VADTRLTWLLGVAGALALTRLVLLPWAESQTEQRQQLDVLTQRLDRSVGVVRNRDAILGAQEKLREDAESTLGIFPEAAGDDESRLAAQRRFNELASRAGLTVSLFDWLMDGDIDEAGLAYSRASIKLEGPLDRLILLHGDLEAMMPFAAVREVQVRSRSPVSGPSAEAVSATLVIDLFYRPAAGKSVSGGAS